MGEFGWAYIKGALTASGPTGSLQFRDDDDGGTTDGVLTGSARLIFNTASNSLLVTGSVIIDGDLIVSGTSFSISSSNLVIHDPIIGLGFGTSSAMTGTAGDRGFIFGLPTNNNQALLWDQTSASFIVGKVGAPGAERAAYDIPEGNYSTLKVGNLRASGSTGEVFAYKILTSGDVNVSGNYSGSKGLFTNQLNVAGPFRVTGSFSGSKGIFNHQLDVAGNLGVSGSTSIKGDFSGSKGIFNHQLNVADNLRVSGSFSGSKGIFNHQLNVAGPLRVTGSISGSKRIF